MAEQFLAEISLELLQAGEVSKEEARAIELIGSTADTIRVEETLIEEKQESVAGPPPEAVLTDKLYGDVRAKIRDLKFPEKIKLALFGNIVCRAVLIYDSSKVIQACVLRNAKISLKEVEDFCRSPNVSQAVLRGIADRKEWMKSYTLKFNLISNPKTPGDLALKWIKFLNAPEIKKLARSKGLPNVVVAAARKRLNELENKQ